MVSHELPPWQGRYPGPCGIFAVDRRTYVQLELGVSVLDATLEPSHKPVEFTTTALSNGRLGPQTRIQAATYGAVARHIGTRPGRPASRFPEPAAAARRTARGVDRRRPRRQHDTRTG